MMDEIKVITTDPYGLVKDSRIIAYLPGTLKTKLPEIGRSNFSYENQATTTAGLYCDAHEALWVQNNK